VSVILSLSPSDGQFKVVLALLCLIRRSRRRDTRKCVVFLGVLASGRGNRVLILSMLV
jgi:hypothetical protein